MPDLDNLDDLLASQMKLQEGEDLPPEDEEEEEEDVQDTESDDLLRDADEDDDSDESEEEEFSEEQQTSEVKPSKEDKKEYAFSELRKENEELRRERERLADYESTIKDLALSNGYTDVEAFKRDLRAAQIAKEAQEKGVDPALYRETAELKEKVARLEAENRQQELIHKAELFRDAIDKAVSEFDLGDEGRGEIFSRLEAAGYTVDLVLQLPNPKIVIDGLLADKIQERTKQEHLKKIEKLGKVADEKHTPNAANAKVTIEDLLQADLSDYKERNNY